MACTSGRLQYTANWQLPTCQNFLTGRFTLNLLGGTGPYKWSISNSSVDDAIAGLESGNVIITSEGTYTLDPWNFNVPYWIEARDTEGCVFSIKIKTTKSEDCGCPPENDDFIGYTACLNGNDLRVDTSCYPTCCNSSQMQLILEGGVPFPPGDPNYPYQVRWYDSTGTDLVILNDGPILDTWNINTRYTWRAVDSVGCIIEGGIKALDCDTSVDISEPTVNIECGLNDGINATGNLPVLTCFADCVCPDLRVWYDIDIQHESGFGQTTAEVFTLCDSSPGTYEIGVTNCDNFPEGTWTATANITRIDNPGNCELTFEVGDILTSTSVPVDAALIDTCCPIQDLCPDPITWNPNPSVNLSIIQCSINQVYDNRTITLTGTIYRELINCCPYCNNTQIDYDRTIIWEANGVEFNRETQRNFDPCSNSPLFAQVTCADAELNYGDDITVKVEYDYGGIWAGNEDVCPDFIGTPITGTTTGSVTIVDGTSIPCCSPSPTPSVTATPVVTCDTPLELEVLSGGDIYVACSATTSSLAARVAPLYIKLPDDNTCCEITGGSATYTITGPNAFNKTGSATLVQSNGLFNVYDIPLEALLDCDTANIGQYDIDIDYTVTTANCGSFNDTVSASDNLTQGEINACQFCGCEGTFSYPSSITEEPGGCLQGVASLAKLTLPDISCQDCDCPDVKAEVEARITTLGGHDETVVFEIGCTGRGERNIINHAIPCSDTSTDFDVEITNITLIDAGECTPLNNPVGNITSGFLTPQQCCYEPCTGVINTATSIVALSDPITCDDGLSPNYYLNFFIAAADCDACCGGALIKYTVQLSGPAGYTAAQSTQVAFCGVGASFKLPLSSTDPAGVYKATITDVELEPTSGGLGEFQCTINDRSSGRSSKVTVDNPEVCNGVTPIRCPEEFYDPFNALVDGVSVDDRIITGVALTDGSLNYTWNPQDRPSGLRIWVGDILEIDAGCSYDPNQYRDFYCKDHCTNNPTEVTGDLIGSLDYLAGQTIVVEIYTECCTSNGSLYGNYCSREDGPEQYFFQVECTQDKKYNFKENFQEIIPTPTPTVTVTPTTTPPVTATPTVTPTTTVTPTVTVTPTFTPTTSVTPGLSPTKSPVVTPTPTITVTLTPTNTPTPTVTATSTPDPTPSPTKTPTPTGSIPVSTECSCIEDGAACGTCGTCQEIGFGEFVCNQTSGNCGVGQTCDEDENNCWNCSVVPSVTPTRTPTSTPLPPPSPSVSPSPGLGYNCEYAGGNPGDGFAFCNPTPILGGTFPSLEACNAAIITDSCGTCGCTYCSGGDITVPCKTCPAGCCCGEIGCETSDPCPGPPPPPTPSVTPTPRCTIGGCVLLWNCTECTYDMLPGNDCTIGGWSWSLGTSDVACQSTNVGTKAGCPDWIISANCCNNCPVGACGCVPQPTPSPTKSPPPTPSPSSTPAIPPSPSPSNSPPPPPTPSPSCGNQDKLCCETELEAECTFWDACDTCPETYPWQADPGVCCDGGGPGYDAIFNGFQL